MWEMTSRQMSTQYLSVSRMLQVPYHYDFRQHLVALAKEQDIPFKLDIYPFYGSDASAAMSAGAEVKHALLGAGIQSSHSYERTHIDSVIATERMVDAYLKSELVD